MSDCEDYLLAEWKGFHQQPERFEASLSAVGGRKISRVLDVGCGAGQELLPFVDALGAHGVGVDVSAKAVEIARRNFAKAGYDGQVEFLCSAAESLPFDDRTFEVVVCRLALQYTRNAEALSEMARVLRPGGLLILKIHHPRYYLRPLWLALRGGNIRMAGAIVRILLNGALYHLTGRQPRQQLKAREVFQTRWMLRHLLAKLGLQIRGELQHSDSNARTPVLLAEKAAA